MDDISESDIRDIFELMNEMDNDIKLDDKIETCPNCNKSDEICDDNTQGYRVCRNCGQVIEAIIDSNPEWRQYDDDKGDSSRCSMPINKLLPQSSLGTTISGGSYRSRIKTLHGWSAMPYKERSLNLVFKDIQLKCQQGGIMKCIEDDAKIMYKSISECRHILGRNQGKYIIIRGANRRSLIAACVFFACKKKNKTRSPKEISDLFKLKYTEMTRGCKNFMKLIKIRKMEINAGTSLPEHFIERFCNNLKIKKEYADQAVKIANNINKLNIASDHTPFSIATGSILLMAECNKFDNITKKIIAEEFSVSEVTITKTYKKLWKYRKIILSNELTNKIIKERIDSNTNHVIPESVIQRMKRFGVNPNESDNSDNIDNDYLDIEDDIESSDDDQYIEHDVDIFREMNVMIAKLRSQIDMIHYNYKKITQEMEDFLYE